jgi:hypothetical protein
MLYAPLTSPHARHMPRPSHPPCFDNPNNTGRRKHSREITQDSVVCDTDLNQRLNVVRLQKLLKGSEVAVSTVSLVALFGLRDRTHISCSRSLHVLLFSGSILLDGIRQVRLKWFMSCHTQHYRNYWPLPPAGTQTDSLTA